MADKTLIRSPSFGDFVFDAVLSAEHTREVTVTSHPVQYGAEIADHSYIEPEAVSIQIGMSDVMAEIGQAAHSVNAYAQLVQMMEARELVTLVTRLGTYDDMIIVSMSVPDEFATMNGLKAQIGFRHVTIVTAAVVLVQNKIGSSKGVGRTTVEKTPDPEEPEDLDENKSAGLWGYDAFKTVLSLFGGGDNSGIDMTGMKMSWDRYQDRQISEAQHEQYETYVGGVTAGLELSYSGEPIGTIKVVDKTPYVKTSDGWVVTSQSGRTPRANNKGK